MATKIYFNIDAKIVLRLWIKWQKRDHNLTLKIPI